VLFEQDSYGLQVEVFRVVIGGGSMKHWSIGNAPHDHTASQPQKHPDLNHDRREGIRTSCGLFTSSLPKKRSYLKKYSQICGHP